MKSKTSYFRLNQQQVQMVFQLDDGIFQTTLPLTIYDEEWDHGRELPKSWSEDYNEKAHIIKSYATEYKSLCQDMESEDLALTGINVSCMWTKDIEKVTSTFLSNFEGYADRLVRYVNEAGNVEIRILERFASEKGFEWDPTRIKPELINDLVIYLQTGHGLLECATPAFLRNLRVFMNDNYPQFPLYWLKPQQSYPGIMSLNDYEYIIARDSHVPSNLQVIQDILIMMVESGLRLRDLSGKTIRVNEEMVSAIVPVGRSSNSATIRLTGTLRGKFWKYRNGIPNIPKSKFDLELRKLFRLLNLNRNVTYYFPNGGFNHKPLCELYTSQCGMDTYIRDQLEGGFNPYQIANSLKLSIKSLENYITHIYDGDVKKDLQESINSIYDE